MLAFTINERRMRANSGIVERTQTAYKGLSWYRYRAKFIGLLEADFDFIVALAADFAVLWPGGAAWAPAAERVAAVPESRLGLVAPHRTAATPRTSKTSLGSCESYDMLPAQTQELIINKLVSSR